jgi:hypothetical protein
MTAITTVAVHSRHTNTGTRTAITTGTERVSTRGGKMILEISTSERYKKLLTGIAVGWDRLRPSRTAIETDIVADFAWGTKPPIAAGEIVTTMTGTGIKTIIRCRPRWQALSLGLQRIITALGNTLEGVNPHSKWHAIQIFGKIVYARLI